MNLKELIPNIDEYTVVSKDDKVTIWTYLNGMENSKEFKNIREYRIKIERLLDMRFLYHD